MRTERLWDVDSGTMDRKSKKSLFDDEDQVAPKRTESRKPAKDAEAAFNINSDFAAQYDRKKRREELSKSTLSAAKSPT